MQNHGQTVTEILIVAAIIGVLVIVSYRAISCSERQPVKEKVHVECLDGFEYYARTFISYYGVGVTLAPRWDKDGKPKRCAVERSDAPH